MKIKIYKNRSAPSPEYSWTWAAVENVIARWFWFKEDERASGFAPTQPAALALAIAEAEALA